ncbi:MAG TPA: hypothetical protein VHQ99_02920 [Gaiellaceae bacterium]|jgi:hypothetical protein|nr:hypothetical protein [Gaiellaceae bacterium]
MTAFVEECRREWERLGVPDLLADEMAADLEADLAEAEADGVSAAEMLGESDPRRFAAIWASERGLVSEPAPPKGRRRVWPWVIVAVVFLAFLLSLLALQTLGSSASSLQEPRPRITVPNVIGMRACPAEKVALDAGLIVRHVPSRRCGARVVGQWPDPGRIVPQPRGPRYTVRLRLRPARR